MEMHENFLTTCDVAYGTIDHINGLVIYPVVHQQLMPIIIHITQVELAAVLARAVYGFFWSTIVVGHKTCSLEEALAHSSPTVSHGLLETLHQVMHET